MKIDSKRHLQRPSLQRPKRQREHIKDQGQVEATRIDFESFATKSMYSFQSIVLLLILMITIVNADKSPTTEPLMINIVNADKSPTTEPFSQSQQYLVVMKEIGLLFNPSGVKEAGWTNNSNLTESITNYLNSEHRSNPRPLHETQTLFKIQPSAELSQLQVELFKTDPEAKIIRELNSIERRGSIGVTTEVPTLHYPIISPAVPPPLSASIGTLYRILQLQEFPWIRNGVPSMPTLASGRLLAMPINDDSEPLDINFSKLLLCSQVKTLYHCDFSTLDILPPDESCLHAIAHKNFSKVEERCLFEYYENHHLIPILDEKDIDYTFFDINRVIPINNETVLVYSMSEKVPTYNCEGYVWNRTWIDAGISILTLPSHCDFKLGNTQIRPYELVNSTPVIELFTIPTVDLVSSTPVIPTIPVSTVDGKHNTQTLLIIAMAVLTIVNFIVLIVVVKHNIKLCRACPRTIINNI